MFPEERMFVPPQISGGPVYSFPSDFKEDLKVLLHCGVAPWGGTGDGESQAVFALSSSFDLPTQRRKVECFN